MARILSVPDFLPWAIGHLTQAKAKYNPHHHIKIFPVHPRDAEERADEFEKIVKEFKPHLICYEYFRSCATLIRKKPFLKEIPSILVHHNQRNKALYYDDWNELGIDVLVCHTEKTKDLLNAKGYFNVKVINHGIDLDYFTFSNQESEEKAMGYVGRIVPWKGLKEIADVADELGYPVQIMGKMDKADYWETINKDPLRFDFLDCPDEERINAYRNMTIYVGFSQDDYEEGTLNLLEAMACGVPVVTTLSGVARDIIEDGVNALVVDFGDKEGLKIQVKRLMKDKELRAKLREGAWQTVKNMTEQKMACEYSKLFHDVLYPSYELVSVIVPTYNRKEQVLQILEALKNQSYPNIETIICDDNSNDGTKEAVLRYREDNTDMAIKYLSTERDGYNLAMARNLGVIESDGKILVFCDSRLKPDKDVVLCFKAALDVEPNAWFFGNKGTGKKSFVENFSAVKRDLFIQFGMFNERIDRYGGMSQEIRTRWKKQGRGFQYIDEAKATELLKSGNKNEKRKDIVNMKFLLYRMYQGDNY